MNAADLGGLSSVVPAEARHRCGPKSSVSKRQEMMTVILAEVGLGDVKVGRALYTLRRRIAARARLDRLTPAPAAIK